MVPAKKCQLFFYVSGRFDLISSVKSPFDIALLYYVPVE